MNKELTQSEVIRLLKRRAKIASELCCIESKISQYLEDNNIQVDEMHYNLGVEVLGNPETSSQHVIEAIKNKKKNKDE